MHGVIMLGNSGTGSNLVHRVNASRLRAKLDDSHEVGGGKGGVVDHIRRPCASPCGRAPPPGALTRPPTWKGVRVP